MSRSIALSATLLCVAASGAFAQQRDSTRAKSDSARRAQPLAAVAVTATRTPTDVFNTPSAVTVIDSATIAQRLQNSPVDLFRDQPGLDVTGVGTNQTRPVIRGLRGQRILLMKDGIRLNNSRRQQDFGELSAIGGIDGIDHVEVVRGPASVLYGTDAIGGVVNLISAPLPGMSMNGQLHGSLGFRASSADDQRLPSASVEGRSGRFSFRANGAYRESNAYEAPSGSFGNITLANDQRVNDTGIRDRSYNAALGFDLARGHQLVAKAEGYAADRAGFGYVDPAKLGDDQPLIRIVYPDQTVGKYSLGYIGTGLGNPLASRVEVTAYTQRNARDLAQNIFIPVVAPGLPPGTGVKYFSSNYTNLATIGLRAEASKLLGRHVLTYGIDAFRDKSENRDSSSSDFFMPGVPGHPQISNTAQVPNASFRSMGVFAQADLHPLDRLQLIVGARGQDIRAETRDTPGITRPSIESTNRTAVGAANVLFRALPTLNLVGSVGRGFRAPNLVERFFEGPTPEGSGYQKSNASLNPETSLNVDIGARFRRDGVFADAFVFRNELHDAISTRVTGDSVQGLAAYQNVNVDRLRYQGVELLAGTTVLDALTLSGNFTRLRSKNISNPNDPVGDSYSTKLGADLSYRAPSGRFWAGYNVRHNGEQKDVNLGENPIGPVLPAFTVHQARAGVLLTDRGAFRNSLSVVVDNLTNELYAEFSNASFFRPEARRSVRVGITTEF